MSFFKIFSTGMLGLLALQAQAQATDQKKPDNPPRCTQIKEGKFLRVNYPESVWYMTIEDNVQTEYFNNGKDFIKSTLVFQYDCHYKATVAEKSDKDDPAQIGDVFSNTIVATQDNLIKINMKIEGSQFDVVYIKEK